MDLSIEFASEQREIVVEVPLINDVFPEELEKFEVHLSACPGVFVDSPSCATIEILNDDPDLPGTYYLVLRPALLVYQNYFSIQCI